MKLGLCISRRATGTIRFRILCRARPVDVPGHVRGRAGLSHQGGVVVVKKLALVTLCVACARRQRVAQDAKTVIANATEGAGRSDIDHVFGIGQGRGVPAVRRQRRRDELPGHARSDAADRQLRPRHRSQRRPRRVTRAATNNIGAGGSTTVTPGHVLPAGHAAAGGRLAAVGAVARALHHAVGLPEGRGREQRDREPRKVDGKNYTVLTLEPDGQGAVGQGLRRSTAT